MAHHKVLLCGGAGFIGSHLVDRLLAEGHEVDVVDDLSTGSLTNLSDARNATGRFKFQNIAIESSEFAELVSLRRPDVIVNLAVFTPSQAHLSGSMSSFRASVAVLEAARLAGVSKVITALPAGLLYGEVAAKDLPIKEGHINDPRGSEEVIARAAADMHTVYRERHGIEFSVLAVSNVYGIRQRAEDGVVAAFVDSLNSGKAPIVHGTGKQSRDFIHVDDVVDALARSLDRAGGLVVNVGTGVATSIVELWALMSGKSALAPRSSAARPHDLARLSLSPVRARIQLGWSPFTALEAGLATLRSAEQ
ncbi:MAG: UDP-glucose 4-epimerase [Actinomycetota bacterium]|jgi:UDP-glucose 4-epimerase